MDLSLCDDERLLRLRHVPEHDMVVRFRYAGVSGIEVQEDVINIATRRSEIVELFLIREILDRDHVNCTDELAIMVLGQKWTSRQRLGVDVKCADAR